MMTKIYILLTSALFLFYGAGAAADSKRKPSPIDIKSTTEIVFFAKKDLGFSDLGKIKEYQGVLEQINEVLEILGELLNATDVGFHFLLYVGQSFDGVFEEFL